jgi:hypothetical protein
MRGIAFLAAFLLLPALGYPLTALRVLRPGNFASRLGLAFGCGAVALCLEMFVFTCVGIRWSILVLLAPFLPWL